MFWGSPKAPRPRPRPGDELDVGTARTPSPMFVATAGLVVVSLRSPFAGPLSEVTTRAGADLIDRARYRVAVLGSGWSPNQMARGVPSVAVRSG